ncbi:MAG: sugar phosphate nucleotidyltransferase [Patescibacteria group bacterium]|jgi:bifunctional N-acetylglucosamine-1-phosphate-uridyltransferase/glucosamine-1-phosphate-acetyltransferase GlmU-like protein
MSIIENTSIIILAAGKGTRLNGGQPSAMPKVMYEICGRPMLAYILETLDSMGFSDITIVVGYQSEKIKEYFGDKYKYAQQTEQRGTGHAVMCALPMADPAKENILVIQGDDSAFYQPQTLQDLIKLRTESGSVISLLTLKHPQPGELGRIIRDQSGNVMAIKEKEVLSDEEKKIDEINAAAYCFSAKWLRENIQNLKPSATGKGELILPDLIHLAVEQKLAVRPHMISNLDEWVGVNTAHQLDIANEIMGRRLKEVK